MVAPVTPSPANSVTAPPVLLAAVVPPAFSVREPPLRVVDTPTDTEIAPLAPLVVRPVPILIAPLAPLFVVPVLNIMSPLTPANTALDVRITTAPLDELVLPPLSTLTAPPLDAFPLPPPRYADPPNTP